MSVLTSYSPASACSPHSPIGWLLHANYEKSQLGPAPQFRHSQRFEYSKQRDAAGPGRGELCRHTPGQWFLCGDLSSGNVRASERFREGSGGLAKITKPLLIITIFYRSSFGIDESLIKSFSLHSVITCVQFIC